MEITLPKAVLDDLPAPDENGLVRVTVAMRVSDGSADIVEVNDTPVAGDSEGGGDTDPSPNAVEASMYQ